MPTTASPITAGDRLFLLSAAHHAGDSTMNRGLSTHLVGRKIIMRAFFLVVAGFLLAQAGEGEAAAQLPIAALHPISITKDAELGVGQDVEAALAKAFVDPPGASDRRMRPSDCRRARRQNTRRDKPSS